MASARAFQYIHTGMYVQGDWGRGRALKSILLPTFGSSFVDQEFQKMTTTLPTQAYAYTVHTIRCIYTYTKYILDMYVYSPTHMYYVMMSSCANELLCSQHHTV